MKQISLYTLEPEWQRLLNQLMNFALSLATDINIMLPPLTYEDTIKPDRVQATWVKRVLQHVIKTQIIPPLYGPFIVAALQDIAEHLSVYNTEQDALAQSGLGPVPNDMPISEAINTLIAML